MVLEAQSETEQESLWKVRNEAFYGKRSKPIMDEIDGALAQHYELTKEEVEFIINYDIKCRVGREKIEY